MKRAKIAATLPESTCARKIPKYLAKAKSGYVGHVNPSNAFVLVCLG